MFNYNNLLKKILQKGGILEISQRINMPIVELVSIIEKGSPFEAIEVYNLCYALNILDNEIESYFFSIKSLENLNTSA